MFNHNLSCHSRVYFVIHRWLVPKNAKLDADARHRYDGTEGVKESLWAHSAKKKKNVNNKKATSNENSTSNDKSCVKLYLKTMTFSF